MRGVTLMVIGLLLIGVLALLASRLTVQPRPVESQPEESEQTNLPPENGPTGSSEPDVVPIWDQWPTPQAALIITGEQHGYFEPCGCTANQMGGMARRADLVSRLQQANWDVRGIDLGGLARRSVRQSQLKFETSLKALLSLNYVALGVGIEELRLQPEFLISQDLPDEDGNTLSLLSANLVFFGSPELGTPLPFRIVDTGKRRIGITSVMSKTTKLKALPEGANSDVTWTDPEPALEKVLQQLDEELVDFRILLSHSHPDESRKLATTFPQFDVIVLSQGFGDPDPGAPLETIGKTLVLQVGHKGKYAGVLGLYDDVERPYRYQCVPLERSEFNDTQSMVDRMADYQQRLRDEQIVLTDGEIAHPSGATFVGVDTCKDCHEESYEVWANSHHAHAYESLDPVHKRTGFERLNGVPRMFDPECLSCHVTGWDPQEYIRYRSGFLNEEFAEGDDISLHERLAGNQCENCHGPASRHVELIEEGEIDLAREEVSITLEQGRKICYGCHDADNSPDFDFDTYWADIEHSESQ